MFLLLSLNKFRGVFVNLLNIYEMLSAIWYHLYNLTNVKNTMGECTFSKTATLLKVSLLHGCFSFLNSTNITKFRKASNMMNLFGDNS